MCSIPDERTDPDVVREENEKFAVLAAAFNDLFAHSPIQNSHASRMKINKCLGILNSFFYRLRTPKGILATSHLNTALNYYACHVELCVAKSKYLPMLISHVIAIEAKGIQLLGLELATSIKSGQFFPALPGKTIAKSLWQWGALWSWDRTNTHPQAVASYYPGMFSTLRHLVSGVSDIDTVYIDGWALIPLSEMTRCIEMANCKLKESMSLFSGIE